MKGRAGNDTNRQQPQDRQRRSQFLPWLSAATGRIPQRSIRNYCEAVGREFHPRKIILFGSYAYGEPSADSDVDLLVVMAFRGKDLDMAIQIRSRFDAPFPLDLLVRKPGFIAERLRERDMFIEQVVNHGVLMYESEHT